MEKPIQEIESENGGIEQQTKDGSICGYESLHHLLHDNLKPHVFQVNFTFSFCSRFEF